MHFGNVDRKTLIWKPGGCPANGSAASPGRLAAERGWTGDCAASRWMALLPAGAGPDHPGASARGASWCAPRSDGIAACVARWVSGRGLPGCRGRRRLGRARIHQPVDPRGTSSPALTDRHRQRGRVLRQPGHASVVFLASRLGIEPHVTMVLGLAGGRRGRRAASPPGWSSFVKPRVLMPFVGLLVIGLSRADPVQDLRRGKCPVSLYRNPGGAPRPDPV